MELNTEIAQAIVERTLPLVDYVVNIMDTEGIIIASTDLKRVGEIHFGAQQVLKTGKSYIMNEERAKKYPHVVPGISLPIHFHGKIVGVVGVGSGTESAQQYGRILQFTTELLLEQIALQEEYELRERLKEDFFQELLLGSYANNKKYYQIQAEAYGVHTDTPYQVFLFESGMGDLNSKEEFMGSEHLKKKLQRALEYGFIDYPRMQIVFITRYVILLFPGITNAEGHEIAEKISHILKKQVKINSTVCICGEVSDLYDIPSCYSKSVSVYEIAGKINNKEIIRSVDFELEYMLLHADRSDAHEYSKKILYKLYEEGNNQSKVLIETLETFFACEMGMTKTAEKLFIHRNTLIFRLHRVQQIIGLNPTVFQDAVKIYLAMLLWKATN